MKPKFLLDEHLDSAIQRQLRRLDFRIEVLRIGDDHAPPRGTYDPDILTWAAEQDFIVVTRDRSTMPTFVADQITQGQKFSGLLWIRPSIGIGDIVDELHLIWLASEAEEYAGKAIYVPL